MQMGESRSKENPQMGESRSPKVPCPALELCVRKGCPATPLTLLQPWQDPAEGRGGTEPRSVSLSRVSLFDQGFQHCADPWFHIPLCCWGC